MSNADEKPDAARSRELVDGYYDDPERRPSFVRDMFNRSAEYYDLVNLLFSLGSGAWYRRFCLRRAGVRKGALVVDVAVGTGLLAREALALAGADGLVIGIDVSEAMLAVAQRNLPIPLIQATAEALPVGPDIADFVTMGYALRHVANLQAALAEALRVLRPGGAIVLLEISAPRNKLGRAITKFFIGTLVPRLSQLVARDIRARTLMLYHWRTILNYMPPDIIIGVLRENGFLNVACTSYAGLFHHYTGYKPANAG
jgi:demethylmenaquinone methyltransferase/2-methoxy-6-polyprenyl-1,4-benzoquinol methylase